MGILQKLAGFWDKKLSQANTIEDINWYPDDPELAELVCVRHPTEDFSNQAEIHVAPGWLAVLNNEGQFIPLPEGKWDFKEGNNSAWKFARTFENAAVKGADGSKGSHYHYQIYYINLKPFRNLKFGTNGATQFIDQQTGSIIHFRAFGGFGARISNDDLTAEQCMEFLKKVPNGKDCVTPQEFAELMKTDIASLLSDRIAKALKGDPANGIPGIQFLEIAAYKYELSKRLKADMDPYFKEFAITLDTFAIENITVPDEDLARYQERLQSYLDKEFESTAMARARAREGYTYQDEQAYKAMQTAAGNQGQIGGFMGAGMGLGMGLGMGAGMGQAFGGMAQQTMGQAHPAGGMPGQQMGQMAPGAAGVNAANPAQQGGTNCKNCGAPLPAGAKFCGACGSKVEEAAHCPNCGAPLAPGAKFCGGCGQPVGAPQTAHCPNCGAELPAGAKFCGACGTKLG